MLIDMNDISDEDYENWFFELGGTNAIDNPSEENLVALFSNTLRETVPRARAQGLVEVANMCLALADKTLGCRISTTKCLVVDRH
jgi:hypothetical protein